MFFKKDVGLNAGDGLGRVYVFRFELDSGEVVHKVGMCNSDRVIDRLFEVLRSFFNTYRYTPRVTLRRSMKTPVPFVVETHLHRLLYEWKYNFDKKFDGSGEFFKDLDETVLLDYLHDFDYTNIDRVEEEDLQKIHEFLYPDVPFVPDSLPF